MSKAKSRLKTSCRVDLSRRSFNEDGSLSEDGTTSESNIPD